MRKTFLIGAALGLTSLMPLCNAALSLTLTSGSTTIVVPGVAGVVTFTGSVGTFAGTFSYGTSNCPGSATRGLLQLTSLSVQNTGPAPASLTLTLSDDNFTAPGKPGDTLTLQSAVGGTLALGQVGDIVKFQSWADSSNALPAQVSTAGPQTYVGVGGPLASFNSTAFSPFLRAGASYSLQNTTTITLSPNAQANVSGTTSTLIPEPAEMSAGLLTIGGLMARRRRA